MPINQKWLSLLHGLVCSGDLSLMTGGLVECNESESCNCGSSVCVIKADQNWN